MIFIWILILFIFYDWLNLIVEISMSNLIWLNFYFRYFFTKFCNSSSYGKFLIQIDFCPIYFNCQLIFIRVLVSLTLAIDWILMLKFLQWTFNLTRVLFMLSGLSVNFHTNFTFINFVWLTKSYICDFHIILIRLDFYSIWLDSSLRKESWNLRFFLYNLFSLSERARM